MSNPGNTNINEGIMSQQTNTAQAKMVVLKNMKPRMFVGELTHAPIKRATDVRRSLDGQTGKVGQRLAEYDIYDTLSLPFGEESKPLDPAALECPSIAGAIRSGWLRVSEVDAPEPDNHSNEDQAAPAVEAKTAAEPAPSAEPAQPDPTPTEESTPAANNGDGDGPEGEVQE